MADIMSTSTSKVSNPTPLGLLGFGMATVMISLYNAGTVPLDVVILSMAVFCGGLVQLIAGIMEYKNGNTFGTVAFILYGVFWLVFVLARVDPFVMGSDGNTTGIFCALWGVFTLFLFVGTLNGRVSFILIFSTLAPVFFMLSAGDFSGVREIIVAAGYLGVLCGALAMYTAFAEIMSEQFGEDVFPY